MSDQPLPGDFAIPDPLPGTLAALLTAALTTSLADAVSALMNTGYDAHIRRIEPRAHGGAEILVEFTPRPPEATLTLEIGEDMVEIPLPPGVRDDVGLDQ